MQFETYKIKEEGKMIKDSKRGHYWTLFIEDKKVEIIAKESFVSKKFRLFVDKKLISN